MSSSARARSGRPGFTLVEVLVALAIFAISAVVLGAAYINIIKVHASLRADADGGGDLQWARDLVLAEPDRGVVERGGDLVLPDGRGATWRATVTPTGVSDLFDVTIELNAPPPDGSGEARRSVQVLRLLRPTWSEEAERNRLREVAGQRLRRAREAVR
jgi:general secretion pathway protein I